MLRSKTLAFVDPNARVLHYILWALVCALYAPVMVQLYNGRWESVDYSHAYVVLPVSVFMVWLKRRQLCAAVSSTPKHDKKVFLCGRGSFISLCAGVFLFVFGWRQDYLLISTVSLVPLLAGLTGYVYGPQILKAVAFPLFYLLFMVPPPMGILDGITLPMRYWISAAAAFILNLFHIPVQRDGLLLFMGGHEIFIAPACSGFRSLITLICLAFLYVYFCKAGKMKKTVLLASTVPLAITGNLLRVLILCLATYFWGPEMTQRMHDLSGIAVFAVVALGFVCIDTLYKDEKE